MPFRLQTRYAKTFGRVTHLNRLIKLGVILLVSWALYAQVFGRDDFDQLWASFTTRLKLQYLYLAVLALILMPLNWLFETLKWQRLVRPIEKVTLWRAYQGILAGVTLSLFTPNRIGEYGGRILVVRSENNAKTVVATLVGSFSQLLVLLIAGMVGLVYFISQNSPVASSVIYGMVGLSAITALVLLFIYLNVELIIPLFEKQRFLRRFTKHIRVLADYSSQTLLIVLTYSTLRYAVYSLQYYLLLRFFGIDVALFPALIGISVIFLVQTSIPLPPITGLFVRGEIALQVWGIYTFNELSILSTTFGLWAINIIIPALLGALFILHINILQTLGVRNIE